MTGGGRILVLGASSFVGRHLLRHLGPARAVGTYCSTPFPGGIAFDALTDRLAQIVDDPAAFSHAVVLLGDTEPDSCVRDSQHSQALNVDSVCRIFDQLTEMGIKPVFTSTEFVFDGRRGNYDEEDDARPILLYGRQKLDAESYLNGLGVPHAILRLAKVFGGELGDGTLFTNWLDQFHPGAVITCAQDQIFSPVHIDDVTTAITRVIERDLSGLFHLSGNKAFRRIELLQILLAAFSSATGVRDITIKPCSIHDFDLSEARPVNVSMRSDKLARATSMTFRDIGAYCNSLCGSAVVPATRRYARHP